MQMTLLAVVTLSPALSPKAIFAPLVYRCIIQAAEKFADLAQRFAPKPSTRRILSLQVTARAMPPIKINRVPCSNRKTPKILAGNILQRLRSFTADW